MQVINALWRLLTHDLDKVLKGAANQVGHVRDVWCVLRLTAVLLNFFD